MLRSEELRGYVEFIREESEEYLVIKKSNKTGADIEFKIALSDIPSAVPSSKSARNRKVAINPAGTGGNGNRLLENTVTDIIDKDGNIKTIDRGGLTFDTAMKVKEKLSNHFQVETTRFIKISLSVNIIIDLRKENF